MTANKQKHDSNAASVRSARQPSTVVHPGKTALHLPTAAITRPDLDGASPLGALPGTALVARNGGLDAAPTQIAAKRLTIIGPISHHLLGTGAGVAAGTRHPDRLQGRLGQRELMGLGAGDIQPNRQPVAFHHRHHLGPLADLGASDAAPPFLAGTKLPSRKAWDQSSFPWASSWLSSARQIRSHVPSSLQARKRRQQVVGEPYSRGISAQAQPVLSTYKIPFNVRRSSARGRPRPGFCLGINGAMMAHCSSVNSCRLMPSSYHIFGFFEISSTVSQLSRRTHSTARSSF
jgi:hypothetical protein